MAASLAKTEQVKPFEFGKNWLSFIELVDEARIQTAQRSLLEALKVPTLAGRTFLDAGCGSGLFSLAASRLGAHVHSFDYDPACTAAAAELRRRFAPDGDWVIEQGSVLDAEYMSTLGAFDVVYSWGVLHHTGEMWRAMDATTRRTAPGGLLYISIYNDQGLASRMWRRVKRRYNASGKATRALLVAGSTAYFGRYWPLLAARRAIARPASRAASAPRARGMSRRHDMIDWVGGYPFEVAKPHEVFDFVRERGLQLRHLKTVAGGIGCNEYVFHNVVAPRALGAGSWNAFHARRWHLIRADRVMPVQTATRFAARSVLEPRQRPSGR